MKRTAGARALAGLLTLALCAALLALPAAAAPAGAPGVG